MHGQKRGRRFPLDATQRHGICVAGLPLQLRQAACQRGQCVRHLFMVHAQRLHGNVGSAAKQRPRLHKVAHGLHDLRGIQHALQQLRCQLALCQALRQRQGARRELLRLFMLARCGQHVPQTGQGARDHGVVDVLLIFGLHALCLSVQWLCLPVAPCLHQNLSQQALRCGKVSGLIHQRGGRPDADGLHEQRLRVLDSTAPQGQAAQLGQRGRSQRVRWVHVCLGDVQHRRPLLRRGTPLCVAFQQHGQPLHVREGAWLPRPMDCLPELEARPGGLKLPLEAPAAR
mmetsp:Transcript_19826/g.50803  ORF Transcript_19826/g.50803 Transcript_19826/m.50803 type:complete len:286 (+) Transcript_19826:904-1761(+)